MTSPGNRTERSGRVAFATQEDLRTSFSLNMSRRRCFCAVLKQCEPILI